MNMNGETSWVMAWGKTIGFPSELPEWFYAGVALLCVYLLVVVPSGTLIAYLDRKLSADLQARVGPNRTGPAGALQPIADFFKLLQKETQDLWNWRQTVWVALHTMALYSSLAAMPLGSLALMVNTEMSVFLPFWSTLILSLGSMLSGLREGTFPGWFGGTRVAIQTLAGAFPALVAILCAGVNAGNFSWSAMASAQGFSPWSWTFASNPFLTIAFLVFAVSGLVLLRIPPLDGCLSMSDLQGGATSHLSGRSLTLFRVSRFYGLFYWAVITVVLFLGAWNLPHQVQEALRSVQAFELLALIELIWLLLKTFLLLLLIVWIGRVNPKSRVDLVTDFSWRVLSPFSLVALIGTSLWVGWRHM